MIKFKAEKVDLDKDADIDEIVSIAADMLRQSLTESDSEDGSVVITCNVAKEPQLPPSAPPLNKSQPRDPMTQIDILFREVENLKKEQILLLHRRLDAANSRIKLQEANVHSAVKDDREQIRLLHRRLDAAHRRINMGITLREFSERFSQGDSRLAELNQFIREAGSPYEEA